MMNNMTTMTMNTLVANAAREAGIGYGELYTVDIIGTENNLCEMVLTTEWNRIECYADMTTGEILGVMAEPKSTDEIINEATERTLAA